MSNSFNISVKPEIAALDAKIDIIDTVVDDIRAVDVVNLACAIGANTTSLTGIRNVDLPDLDTLIDGAITKIDTIDTLCDDIKIKTDALPQNVRGHFSKYRTQSNSDTFQNVCNITGSGKIYSISVGLSNAASTLEFSITIDGLESVLKTHTGDLISQSIIIHDQSLNLTDFWVVKIPYDATLNQMILCEFDTSLLIRIRRSAGTVANVMCMVVCSIDDF